jgi:hypothetical protein
MTPNPKFARNGFAKMKDRVRNTAWIVNVFYLVVARKDFRLDGHTVKNSHNAMIIQRGPTIKDIGGLKVVVPYFMEPQALPLKSMPQVGFSGYIAMIPMEVDL